MPIPRDERHYRRGLILGLTLSEIMLLLLFLLLLLLSYLMGKEEDKRDKLQAELTGITGELRATASVNSGLVDQIKELVRSGSTLAAVKMYSELMNVDLKTAKDWVDNYR